MTEQAAYEALLQPHLDRVSRSFAVCIAELEEPLRSWTGIAYLICRLLDTVEDAPWPQGEAQGRAFDALDSFLRAPPTPRTASVWAQSFPQDLPPGEVDLLRDNYRIIGALHALPPAARQSVQSVAQRMSQGMRHYAQAWKQRGILRLADVEDVNRYCYFVAGVVGELLTKLFALSNHTYQPTADTWRDAQHFGLFLQKVNLLKDQSKDELEHRFLVPCRSALFGSLPAHAEGALRYVTSLPHNARAFRIFCAWSMALGAASLPFIQADFEQARSESGERATIKIGRAQSRALMDEVASMATDNLALEQAMRAAMALLPELPPAAEQPSRPRHGATSAADVTPEAQRTWFLALDHGPLRRQDLSALGMAPAQA